MKKSLPNSRLAATAKRVIAAALIFFSVIATCDQLAVKTPTITMRLSVDPELHSLQGKASYDLVLKAGEQYSLLIGPNINVQVTSGDATVSPGQINSEGLREITVTAMSDIPMLTLKFDGRFDNPANNVINADRLVLLGGLGWYPRPKEVQQQTPLRHLLHLEIDLPANWSSVTSGTLAQSTATGGRNIETWQIEQPQEALDWVAGPYTVETSTHSGLLLSTHFHTRDSALSQRYLNALPGFIDHYAAEIAPYPFSRFSIVENQQETGLGMAGFTLLGSSVLRLPFIFTSSLPHEVLHNWWGNSVYVDYGSGNWCEGLTTYMADHWQQELLGQDAEYRRATLAGFADYADGGRDFPLREFEGRHSSSTQAVGYGKAMMLFHMLKQRVGEPLFRRSLQRFYRENKFKRASWTDMTSAFETETSQALAPYFNQWLDRKGMAKLSLESAVQRSTENGERELCLKLTQDPSAVFDIDVPIDIQFADGTSSHTAVALNSAELSTCSVHKKDPVLVSVDRSFEVFRRLNLEERPPSLSTVLGGSSISIQYDSTEVSTPFATAFSNAWIESVEGEVQLIDHGTSAVGPLNGPIALLGDSTVHGDLVEPLLQSYGVQRTPGFIEIDGVKFDLSVKTVALTVRDPKSGYSIAWILGAVPTEAFSKELANRLTHYGKYGALVFDSGKNELKKVWPIVQSPLTKVPSAEENSQTAPTYEDRRHPSRPTRSD